MPGSDAPGGGREFIGMLGIDAAFDGVTSELNIALAEGQFFARCDEDLLTHDVNAGNHLGNGMFNLHAGVHFDKEKFAILIEEFKSTGAAIADLATRLCAALAYLVAQARIEHRCRRLLYDLLVATLHRAIALAQIDGIAMLICQYLKFNVARIFQVLFHVYRGIVERGLRFRFCHGNRIEQGRLGMHHAHAAPATAARSLDDDRVANAARDLDDLGGIVRQRAFYARYAGHAGLFHGNLGAHLVAHQAYRFSARADEYKTAFFHTFGKIGVFREEAIARMNRLGIGYFRCADDGGDVQITQVRRRRAYTNGLVGEFYVLGIGICFGMHDNGFNTHLATGALDA